MEDYGDRKIYQDQTDHDSGAAKMRKRQHLTAGTPCLRDKDGVAGEINCSKRFAISEFGPLPFVLSQSNFVRVALVYVCLARPLREEDRRACHLRTSPQPRPSGRYRRLVLWLIGVAEAGVISTKNDPEGNIG